MSKEHPDAWIPFLATFKPMLRRARNTPSYADVCKLIELWMYAKRMRRLLDNQNASLYSSSRQRDALLTELAR